MKNLLIIGGSGFLGHYIISRFNKKYNIFCHQNKTKFKYSKNFKVIKIDIFKKKVLQNFLEKEKINLILNLASLTNVEKCQKNKKLCKKIHILLTKKIFDASINTNVKLIHISTDHLFDGKKKGAYSEEDLIKPVNNYGTSKFKGEKNILKKKGSLVLRTNFFGKNYKNKNSFSDKIVENLKKQKKVYLWDDIYFSPLHVKVLADIIYFLIKKKHSGILNLSSEKINKKELGEKIAKILKLNKKLIVGNTFNKKNFVTRPKNMSLSNKKLLSIYPVLKKKTTLNHQLNLIYKDYNG